MGAIVDFVRRVPGEEGATRPEVEIDQTSWRTCCGPGPSGTSGLAGTAGARLDHRFPGRSWHGRYTLRVVLACNQHAIG